MPAPVIGTKTGDVGEGVASLQRYLYYLWKSNPTKFAKPSTSGTMDAATVAALKRYQSQIKVPVTGVWDAKTSAGATNLTKYLTAGQQTNPFVNVDYGGRTLTGDRTWVYNQYNAILGRPPTNAELDNMSNRLAEGNTRSTMTAYIERQEPDRRVREVYETVLGRQPTPAELNQWKSQVAAGKSTITQMTTYLAATPEALNRPKGPVSELSPDQEDSRAVLNNMLDSYGLGSLKDWAWEQIKSGHGATRIMQDLRQTDPYKQRFAGLVARQEGGLPAMTEAEYLDYESQAETIMRSAGMPPALRSREVYANLIANNVSPAELNDRVNDGYARVNTAAPAIRNQFTEWFGPAGDGMLAAFFLEPERALPDLRKMVTEAEIGGTGDQFGYELSQEKAGQIADTGMTGEQSRSAFDQLQQLDPLFTETIDEQLDLTAEEQGADAVFQLGGTGKTDIERRARTRSAATKGGGGANITQEGVGIGTAQ